MSTQIKFLSNKKFKNAVLFTGLPGIGLVGKIVVDYLLKEFNAVKVAEVLSDSFPPSVHTIDGLIELIKDEIYHYSFNGQDYLFLAGPVQPTLDGRGGMAEHYEFAKAIVDALAERGMNRVYTLAGINIGERRMFEAPQVVVAATAKELISEWKKVGGVADKPEGLISGIAGLLLGLANERGIQGACLMGETNAKLIYGDHGAAKKVLELLIKKFGFKVKMDRIEKEAKEIEETFKRLEEQLQGPPEETPKEGLSYVR